MVLHLVHEYFLSKVNEHRFEVDINFHHKDIQQTLSIVLMSLRLRPLADK